MRLPLLMRDQLLLDAVRVHYVRNDLDVFLLLFLVVDIVPLYLVPPPRFIIIYVSVRCIWLHLR